MKYIFISDQGHRKDTSGKNANGLYEYEFNQDVAERVNKLLESYGEVYFTMTTENHPYNEQTSSGRTKNLQYRCDVANNIYKDAIKKYGKDNVKCVLVSIHANAFDNPSASGYEIYVYKKSLESYKIAQSIYNSAKDILEVGTSIKDRGIKEANFYVLKHTSMSSLLIEHEFYTNPEAVKKLKDNNFRQKCAEHIAKGLCDYYGIKYKEPQNNNKTDNKINDDTIYKVQVGAYKDKNNAEDILNKLKEAGFEGFINKTDIENKNDKKETEPTEKPIDKPIVKGDDNLKLEYKGLVKKGSRGNNVKELQEILNKLGYNCGNADGIAGNNTITQIKNLQKDCGLVSDGMAGQATYNKINELLSGKVVSKPANQPKTSESKQCEILHPDRQTTIVKIPRNQIKDIDIILANTKSNRETVGSMQKRTGYDFLINGGLFWYESKTGKSHSLNLLIDEGKQNNAGIYSRYGLMIYKDGSYKFGWYKWSKDLKDMIGGSPTLIIDGKINIDKGQMNGGLITARHPRSAIGVNDDYFFMVTIDGRNSKQGLYGMTINELAKFMLSIGCKYALNCDGGGSTRLMYNGKLLNKVPENRPVHNCIGVKLK